MHGSANKQPILASPVNILRGGNLSPDDTGQLTFCVVPSRSSAVRPCTALLTTPVEVVIDVLRPEAGVLFKVATTSIIQAKTN